MDLVTFAAVAALHFTSVQGQPAYVLPITSIRTSVDQESDTKRRRWAPLVCAASRRFDIPANWIKAVIQAESGGDPQALSPKGAMGLMQIMPRTYAMLRRPLGLGADADDPANNILAGAAYLRVLFDRFGYPALFAAYNAGPTRFRSYLRDDENLPAETWDYLARLGHGIVPKVQAMAADAGQTRDDPAAIFASKSPNFSGGRTLFFALQMNGKGVSAASKTTTRGANFGAKGASISVPRHDKFSSIRAASSASLSVPVSGTRR